MDGDLACRLGIYELHVQDAMVRVLKRGGVFYDVGANNGFLSLLAAEAVGRTGHVYAFEPLPENVQRVRHAMSKNDVAHCTIIAEAISDEVGAVNLFPGRKGDTATASLIRGHREQSLTVHATTLDAFAAEHRRASLIKVDVEGAEEHVLEGASTLLSSDPAPTWLIEVHSQENDRRIRELLGTKGYSTRALPCPYPKRPLYPRHVLGWKGHRRRAEIGAHAVGVEESTQDDSQA